MKATPVIAVLAVAAIATALWVTRGDDRRPRPEIRRRAFELPHPDEETKNAYFFDLMRSGTTLRLGDANIPVWSTFGQAGLVERGDSALGYLMDPARYPIYGASSNVMINALQVLEQAPESRIHPSYEPFAKYWLDPANTPRSAPGANPAEEYRKQFFTLFTREPREWVIPYCLQEIDRADRPHDMRMQAIAILLWLGRADEVLARYDTLPPNKKEPDVRLKPFVLSKTRGYAGRDQPSNRREGARRLEPLLRRSLDDESLFTRVIAASALLRLGDKSMVDRLIEYYEEGVVNQEPDAAWTALVYASDDSDDPRLRDICEAHIAAQTDKVYFTYVMALQVLAARWIDDKKVRDLLWDYVKVRRFEDLRPILWLSHHEGERPRIIAALREAIRSGDTRMMRQATRFAVHPNYPLPELMPDVLDMTRRTQAGEGRDRLIHALIEMKFRPVLPLILAELSDELPRTRATAAANLLEFGDEEGIEAVAARLLDGDEAMLGPIQGRAQAAGTLGVDDALLPALLDTLERAPSELIRMRVLYTLRCRATLEGVEKGLMEAYRREPSRRVAAAIRATLIELAHR